MELIKNFLYPNRNDILDPLSLVVKLYIYSFKSIGTKISILGNKIDIQESGIFQSTVRTIYGDTKNDLINMLVPLTWACEFYLGNLESDKSDKSTRFIKLFDGILKSFDKLNQTYKFNETTLNIEQLKNITKNFLLNNKFNPESIVSSWNSTQTGLKKNYYVQTNKVWDNNKFKILIGFINEIESIYDDEPEKINFLVNSLSQFMNYIDNIVINEIAKLYI